MRKILLCSLLLLFGAVCAATQTQSPAPAAGPESRIMRATVNAGAGTHSVTLQGCVDTTPGVSFNFYRGTVPTSGGVYFESTTPLNATPLAACSFVDTTVLGNTTYYYVAKAYLATAAPPGLSSPSNEVAAVVPPDPTPNAPTGLSLGTVAQNKVPLQWNAPANQGGYVVVAYEVLRGSKPTLPAPAIIAIVPNSTLAWTDGSCSKCYYAVRSMTIKTAESFVLSPMSNIVGPS